MMKNQKGQVVLILILVMTVALAIGLSVIQRSLSDVSTSSKVEQSSRAFSAAEAGIEQALSGGSTAVNFSTNTNSNINNNSSATVDVNNLIPAIPSGFNRQDPLECPPNDSRLAKEDVAQIWLADPGSSTNPPALAYKQTSLDVYWGNSASDNAALELIFVYYDGSQYKNFKKYLDQIDRNSANGFDNPTNSSVTCPGNIPLTYADGTPSNKYQCKETITSLPANLMLLRARMLYNRESQPFAVQATGTCGQACSIPPQAKVLASTGTSGQTQRKVQVCQTEKVVPSYFDYAIFSESDINK